MPGFARILLLLLCAAGSQHAAYAKPHQPHHFLGRTVYAVIDEFRAQGWSFAYSTNLVNAAMTVTVEPESTEPVEIVREILKPHRLTIRKQDDFYLVVRMSKAELQATPTSSHVLTDPAVPVLETITVSASRYQVSRDISNSLFYLDQRTIQNMPDLGEDPVRIAQRLPGTSAGGISAKTHIRGGEDNETGIVLNGYRLFDPFHIRDYLSIFSSVDSRAINGVEVYTGGFPAQYGDRMSGLVLIDTLNPDQPKRTELGLSVFNSSFLSSGTVADGAAQWLLSARRGNLDLIIDRKFGQPRYYDLFGQISVNFSPDTQLSANWLFAQDDVLIVLESAPDELEQSKSNTRNAQFWTRLDNRWTEALSSTSVLSIGSFRNNRIANTGDEQKFVSEVDDKRRVDQFGLRQDWTWGISDRHQLQWGFKIEHSKAVYDYQSAAEYFGLSALLVGAPNLRSNTVAAKPNGESYALYLSERWKFAGHSFLETGLRWDRQTYTAPNSDSQLSPRISVFHPLSSSTDLRFSWGRYYQSQGINELQVEDGISDFSRAQRADHIIAGLYHRFRSGNSLRLEAFQKDMSRLRPRFENLFNPLTLIPELAADRVKISPSKARARGIEISFNHSGPGPFSWWTSYTFSSVTDTVNGKKRSRSWDQRHSWLAGVSFSTEKWEAGMVANVRTGWPQTKLLLVENLDINGESQLETVTGPRNASRYKVFATLDARISRKFAVKHGKLSAFFELTNATNRRNKCCSDYEINEDRDGNAILDLSKDNWLPLLPAVGILWEF